LLIGGASGTGKTTVANALVQELGLAHHISTGFVREVARAMMPADQAFLLDGFTFDAWRLFPEIAGNGHRVFDGALAQAEVLLPAVKACISRSVREGASLILEGAHMLPGLLSGDDLGVSLFCILDVPDRDTLVERALGQTHSRRNLSQAQIAGIIELQDACVMQARRAGIQVIENVDLATTVERIKKMLTGAVDE
jgi:2-phosphoglycerate kinase